MERRQLGLGGSLGVGSMLGPVALKASATSAKPIEETMFISEDRDRQPSHGGADGPDVAPAGPT